MKCEQCFKKASLCVCDSIQPLPTKTFVLILQHPQEPDHELGSARLAHLALPHSSLKVGLSWPNLKAVLPAEAPQQPTQWAVLYLGSGVKGKPTTSPLQFISKKGDPIETPPGIKGLIILDGTWSQAKALWWRNPWLLKVKRAVLIPSRKSLYGNLRKEPRKECLSTIESIAEALEGLRESPEVGQNLRDLFGKLLDKKRGGKKPKASSPDSATKREENGA